MHSISQKHQTLCEGVSRSCQCFLPGFQKSDYFLDVLGIINYIIQNESDNYYVWASDLNEDNNIDILDIIDLINTILNS